MVVACVFLRLLGMHRALTCCCSIAALSTPHIYKQNFELAINRDNASLDNEETLLSNDIRGHIRPSLAAMKEAVVKRMHEARQQLLELLDAEEARSALLLLLVHIMKCKV
jgi:hypothetical protein